MNRRVHQLTGLLGSTLLGTNPEMKRRRPRLSIPSSRRLPLNAVRSNTVSVPAHRPEDRSEHPPSRAAVTLPDESRDHAGLIAAAAARDDVSDRALRVYTVVVTSFDREVTAAQVAAILPSLEEAQAARLLGDLVSAGLLVKRLRTIGYKGVQRVRRGCYSLSGVTR